MTHIKRVVDARSTQGRLIYHLKCGHIVHAKTPVQVMCLPEPPRDAMVGDPMDCANCEEDKTPVVLEHPRFAEHWSRCYAAYIGARPTADIDLYRRLADSDLEAYRKRFP